MKSLDPHFFQDSAFANDRVWMDSGDFDTLMRVARSAGVVRPGYMLAELKFVPASSLAARIWQWRVD